MGTRIVVGVDDSPNSRRALEFAVDEAGRRGDAVVEAVMAFPMPVYPGIEYGLTPLPEEQLRGAAVRALNAFVDDLDTDVEISRRVVQGSPGLVLVDESQDADLVVVGSRGRGGFRSLLLGSTSHQVVSHAHCPVVVVPLRDHEDAPLDDQVEADADA